MISSIKVSNFQRIDKGVEVSLGSVTVLVGENGAGKSSILKAIHWAARCATLADGSGKVTLEQMDYVPSKSFLDLGNKLKIQNNANGRKISIVFKDHAGDESSIEISAARNEAGVNVGASGNLISLLNNGEKPSTAYIPGLAGLAEEETILATPVMHRKAASGEGGTVLRQVLLELARRIGDDTKQHVELTSLSELISRVLPGMKIWVKFDQLRDRNIDVRFLTDDMRVVGQRQDVAWKSIEMAGTGFLQIVQIFAYWLYFKPRLLLIDEPDAHLHPDSQRRLMRAILETSKTYPETQIIISTHSSVMVSSIDENSTIHWISDGEAKQHGDPVKDRMGWNLLDRDMIIFSEDGNEKLLKAVLAQWPDLEARCSIWPTFGKDGLPAGDKAAKIAKRFGLKVLVHRDRDFMSDSEAKLWCEKKEYVRAGIPVWITAGSDIEAEFCSRQYLKHVLQVDDDIIDVIFDRAMKMFDRAECEKEFISRYEAATNKLSDDVKEGGIARYQCLGSFGEGTVLGKDLKEKIRQAAIDEFKEREMQDQLSNIPKIDRPTGDVARELGDLIRESLSKP